MTAYSLIKIGNDYVVRADDQCILKIASRRRAAVLISDAVTLLNADAGSAPERDASHGAPSSPRETPEVP